MKPIILTGDRLQQKLHIDIMLGVLKNRVLLQEEDSMRCLFWRTNKTDHAKRPQTIVESIGNVALII